MAGKNSKSIALVCSSNQNRSMEAHQLLAKMGFNVRSYGTGTQVKLPGPSFDRPNIYDFGTPYAAMADDLRRKDSDLYTSNGILPMVERNKLIKKAPERFVDSLQYRHPVVICFEERVFDAALEVLSERGSKVNEPVHVFNIEVKDTHEDAVVGANCAMVLAQMVTDAEDLDEAIDEISEAFEKRTGKSLLHTIMFY